MRFRSLLYAAMVAAVPAAVLPPASHAATDLLEAWQAAQQHDPVYAAARAQWQAGQTRERQARALLAPNVSLAASAGVLAMDRDTQGAQFSAPGFGASNDARFRTRIEGGGIASWTITAQQPIYSVERQASARQLEHQAEVADWQFRADQQALALRAADAYFAALLAEETLATLSAQKRAAGRALDEAKERFDAGATPVTDRNDAQARYDAVHAQEIAARNEVEIRRAAFRDLTGRPGTDLAALPAGTALQPVAVAPLAEWLDRAAQGNPLVAMQELGRTIARDEVLKFRGLTSPSVDLVARVSDERMRGSSGYGPTTDITSTLATIGVQVAIPLYTGGMRSARRDEALALAEKAQYDAEALRQEVQRQTRAAWLAVSTGYERVRAHEQALDSAASRLDATQTGREAGARTTLDVLNAQSDFFQAQRSLLQARYHLLLDRLRLAAAAGALGEAEVREINTLLTRR